MRSPGGSPVALARIETPESTSTPRAQGRKRRNRLVFFRGVPFWPRIRPGKRIPISQALDSHRESGTYWSPKARIEPGLCQSPARRQRWIRLERVRPAPSLGLLADPCPGSSGVIHHRVSTSTFWFELSSGSFIGLTRVPECRALLKARVRPGLDRSDIGFIGRLLSENIWTDFRDDPRRYPLQK